MSPIFSFPDDMRLYLQLRPAGTSYILQLHFVLAELVVTSQAVVRLSLAPAPSTPSSLHLLEQLLPGGRLAGVQA